MTISPRALLGGALIAVAAACIPTDACGCTLAPPHVEFSGQVRAANGSPVAGARVHALVMPAGCALIQAETQPVGEQPRSDLSGGYQLEVWFPHGQPRCLRLVAERAPGDSAFTEIASFQVAAGTRDVVRRQVDIIFP